LLLPVFFGSLASQGGTTSAVASYSGPVFFSTKLKNHFN